jgi:hypothetical protein
VRQLLEDKLFELDELKAFGREIDNDVVLIGADFIAGLKKDGGFAAAFAAKDYI